MFHYIIVAHRPYTMYDRLHRWIATQVFTAAYKRATTRLTAEEERKHFWGPSNVKWQPCAFSCFRFLIKVKVLTARGPPIEPSCRRRPILSDI